MNQRAEVKRRKKSFWAMLLAVLLIINMIPASVYAADIEMGIAKDESSVSDYKGKIVTAGDTMTWTFQSAVDGYSMDQYVSIIYEYKNVEKSEMITGTPDADNKTGYSTGDKFHYSYAVKNLANAGFTVDATDPSSAISGYKIKSINENTGYSGGYYFYELQLQAVYSVEFVTAHGTAPATQYAAYGETVADPGALSSDHYDFDGWYTDNSFDENSKWDFKNNTVTQNTVLYAKWIPKKYTITWIDEDDTVLETDQNVDAGTIPTYDGTEPTKQSGSQYEYTFAGWNPTPVEVAGDATYKATYTETERKYDVTFNKNGHGKEDAPSSQSVAYNGTVTKPTDLTDDCYDFGGWYKESSCQNAWDFDKDTVTIKTVIYAKWTPKTFGISYELDGGTNSASNPTNYTYGIGVKSLENATKTGHDFNGWFISRDFEKPVLSPVIPDDLYGNVVFYAKFTPKEYKINYVMNGGTNPEINPLKYTYGQGVRSLVDPSKTGHTFKGWYTDPEFKTPIGSVVVSDTDMGDKTFYARWDINKYTITWKNIGGAILETDVNVEYGTTPTYDGTTPTTEGTAEYSYSFDGWNPSVKKVDDDAEYTAKYKSTKNKYTVTWKNDNGTVLETDKEVEYGTTPTYDGTTPTKGTDKQYSYTFDGWNPEVKTVTDDATYEAKFKSTVNKYTVTWKNDDGTTLETDNDVPYGTIPTYDSATPTKKATAHYTYSFSGWSPTVEAITGNTVYTAQYTPTVSKYTVTWKNDGGKVLETDTDVPYGTTPTYDGATPTKKATAQYTYSFSGWSPTVDAITGNTVYTAQYTPTVNKYTVTWKNDDGTVLETETDVPYGTTPTYDGATPTKKATAQYTYSFSGWSPTVEAITGNTVYTAQYSDTVNKYTVTWKNIGQTIETDTNVEYGEMPTYDGATPTKKADKQYSYTFDGWNPEVETVTGDASYEAKYKPAVNKYKVTFVDEDGTTVLKAAASYEYGTKAADIVRPKKPTKTATAEWTYTFDGWTPAITDVTDNATYKATYTATRNKYNVTFVDEDGTTVLKDAAEYEYGTKAAEIVKPENPKKKATAEYTYTFAGWSPEITDVTGTATYKATYTATKNKYKVTFVDEDGTTVLKDAEEYEYGTKAADIEKPVDPIKEANAEYTYTFAGWSPELKDVTGNVTYKAVYSAKKNQYKITFVDEDGTTILKDATPYDYGTSAEDIVKPVAEKASTEEYVYEFAGWTPEVTEVTGDKTYTAVYTEKDRLYKVTFVDDDGTSVIKVKDSEGNEVDSISYKYGTKSSEVATPDTPEKASTAEFSYSFAGWEPAVTDVIEDAVYKAVYIYTLRQYYVTFVDDDGVTVLKEKTLYDYGTEASEIVKPEDPVKAEDEDYIYSFAGWEPSIEEVTGDVIYKAVYNKTSKKPVTYSIRYDLNGGTLDGKTGVISIQAEEGTVITIPDAPTKDGYKFLYWKGSEYHPGDKYTVVGDHTFTAEWQMIVKDEPKKEEPKKDKDTPGTGDAADPLLWMAISMCALSGIIFIRKKKRQ